MLIVFKRGDHTEPNTSPAFDETCIKSLFTKERILNKDIFSKHVYVSLDPACGGARSKCAIVSCIYTEDDNMVVCTFIYFSYSRTHQRFIAAADSVVVVVISTAFTILIHTRY
mgnify:FL=1